MTFSTGSIGYVDSSVRSSPFDLQSTDTRRYVCSLNGLTVANRLHILEPQWNPAVESQAIGRVLRLDQQRQVTVVRYAMQRSIEEVRARAHDNCEAEKLANS